MYFQPNRDIVIRAVINQRIWFAQSAQVVKDDINETVLWTAQNSQLAAPENYINGTNYVGNSRWIEAKQNAWKLKITFWKKSNVLTIRNPQDFFSVKLFWDAKTNNFWGYYVNFELPYVRNNCGFNTLDLDLDIQVDKDLRWNYKDVEDYQKGIVLGGIKKEWASEIEASKNGIIEKIETGQYPFNGVWQNWKPDKAKQRASSFINGWDQV